MSEELRSRLARLRREEPGQGPARSRSLPAWIVARLDARRAEPAPEVGGARSLGLPEALEEARGPRGAFAYRRALLAPEHLHGDWRLADVRASSREELAWLARDARLAELDPESCVYLDIETSGLSGGAGTIPFLVALGRFDGPRFELWQAFLRGPEEEAAALEEVAERIRASSGVVSFFGKSFDRHRLEDKMRLHRIGPPFADRPHLDLYHPLTRLYRGAFANGRLATFEHELCGVERGYDLPGSLAPSAWFDFLAGRAHRLEAVFRHNAQDVLSLVVLAAHLGCSRREARADGRALAGCGRARARALAELCAGRREYASALEWLERALVRPGSHEAELWFRHAELLRLLGERERALEEFLRLAREREGALAARAWVAAAALARRMKRAELWPEILAHGPAAAEHGLAGSARERALASFARLSRPALS